MKYFCLLHNCWLTEKQVNKKCLNENQATKRRPIKKCKHLIELEEARK